MRKFEDHVEEEYVYLGDVTHDAALISWGKFFFNSKWKLVPDKKIHVFQGQENRHTSIGANCESYGTVTVEVLDAAGAVVKSLQTDKTFAWITGLAANTEYQYRVLAPESGGGVRVWGAGHLWYYHKSNKELEETQLTYSARFRTFPDPNAHEDLTFAIIGDTGTADDVQLSVARALEEAVAKRGIRLVLMVGDTIYNNDGSGDEDFEWLTTFFQPYRTIIDHIPFFPCVGNHDTAETSGEKQEDRLTLYDNLLVLPRFWPTAPLTRAASVTPGLFYRFRFGADIEFICIDTSKEPSVTSERMFEYKHHKTWLQQALANPLGTPRWRLPFSHHPPYCKGPLHDEDETRLRTEVIPLCEANGIRAFFSGHEHNEQCIDSQDAGPSVRCFISGGAGGFRTGKPTKATDGFMHSWGGNDRGHFLIVTIRGNEMKVEPIGVKTGEQPAPLPLQNVLGKPLPVGPISVKLPG